MSKEKLLINDGKSNNFEFMRNKQIEETADDVRRIRESYYGQADYLFAVKLYEDGYRKQEWISVEERLPEKSGDYLTYHNGVFDTLMYSAKYRLFNATDGLSEEHCLKYNVKVTHWMPLPEAPKMRKEDEGK